MLLVEDLALEETHLCAGDGLIVEPAERTRRSGQLVVARHTEPDEIAALSLAKVSEGGQLVGMAKQASVMPCELSHAQVQGVVSSMVRLYR